MKDMKNRRWERTWKEFLGREI